MFGDYGYIEEGQLGRPYNLRLLKRLARYALPYKRIIGAALFLTVLITLADLATPYFSKIAIDRFILAGWYQLDTRVKDAGDSSLWAPYRDLFLEARTPGVFYVSESDLKEMDPSDVHALKQAGVLTSARFYRVDAALARETGVLSGVEKWDRGRRDGAVFIPYKRLSEMPTGRLLRLRAGDIRGVAGIALLFLGLLVVSFGLNAAQFYLLELSGQRMMLNIRMELFDRMLGQALRFFDRHPVGRLVTRVTNDIENLNEMFKSVFITLYKDLFLLAGILVVLLVLNWRMALLSFILIPFIFGIAFLFSNLAREAFRRVRSTVSKINAFLQERISGMRVIQLFAAEAQQMQAFQTINEESFRAGLRQVQVFAVFMPIMEFMSALAVAFAIWYGGGRILQEELTLGSLVAFISYLQMFFKPIRDISEKYNIMQSAMASSERIFEFMDHQEEIPQPAKAVTPVNPKGAISFENVTFGYEANRPVLHDVSFDLRPGEMAAVVGQTGSGKSTLVHLLERFADPDAGRILMDGVDLREWSHRELRRRLALVTQDVFLFAGTSEENIAMGRAGLDRQAVRRAAEQVNALGFIERLEQGFDQEIGEGGSSLSAGQRQLLSFARALAGDPPVLILDEATSSVDPETERLIQEAIARMSRRRTTLVIAHRLSTIREADQILVMHQGRICERGTHDELMAEQGVYFKLNRLWEV